MLMMYTRPTAPGITDCALAFENMNTTLFSKPSDANPIKFLNRASSPATCRRLGERGGEPEGLPLLVARANGGDAVAMGAMCPQGAFPNNNVKEAIRERGYPDRTSSARVCREG